MVVVTLGGMLVGAVFGTRFTVLVIVPAAILGLIVVTLVAAVGCRHGHRLYDFIADRIYRRALHRFLMVATRAAVQRSWRSHVART
jgi:hypothetical protein